MTLLSLNVYSLIAKIDEVRFLVKNENIDILAISETILERKIDDRLIALEDFSLCRFDRNRKGGGDALFVRNTDRFKPREDLPNRSLELIGTRAESPNSTHFTVIVQ